MFPAGSQDAAADLSSRKKPLLSQEEMAGEQILCCSHKAELKQVEVGEIALAQPQLL